MSLREWRNAMNDHIGQVEADALQKLDQVCKQEAIIVSDHIAEIKSSIAAIDTSHRMLMKIINTIELSKLSLRNTHCNSPDGQKLYYTTENKIVTTNTKGQPLKTFECKNLKIAYGITLDKKGIIYCCGYKSNTVVQLFLEGRQLAVLLSQNCGLKQPVGLCLNDKSNTVLVYEDNSDYVRVFRLK
ncbi:hypothetical protein CHS0354_009536 [Potamilus streckersoni]|uniref:Uncharacterized protein n=1 Tax=Potamilus streckersoni TaxID=2493646 RepID=A0AAE0SP76_9BIVA|nr:hypothetical protein CHS0354_009536 [Potamilus streckersoni]